MNIKTIDIKIFRPVSGTDDAKVIIYELSDVIKIEFIYENIKIIEEDEFYFWAFEKVRLKLEKYDILCMCNGCRYDVYPTSMQLDSFMAYEMELRKPALNLVNIFDYTDKIDKLCTVKVQFEYYNTWFNSF